MSTTPSSTSKASTRKNSTTRTTKSTTLFFTTTERTTTAVTLQQTKTTTSTTTIKNYYNLVKNCTLPKHAAGVLGDKPTTFEIDAKKYCWTYVGNFNYDSAVVRCKSLNAKLPLPRNLKEQLAYKQSFAKIKTVHLGMKNHGKLGKSFPCRYTRNYGL